MSQDKLSSLDHYMLYGQLSEIDDFKEGVDLEQLKMAPFKRFFGDKWKESDAKDALAADKVLRFTELSPEDGRYRNKLERLKSILCEANYIRSRIIVSSLWLKFQFQHVLPRGTVEFTNEEFEKIFDFANNMPVDFALRVGEIEDKRHHDVIATIEALREKFSDILDEQRQGFFHLGLTSEDVNDLSQKMMFRNALKVLNESFNNLLNVFEKTAEERLDDLRDPDHKDVTLGAKYREMKKDLEKFQEAIFEPNLTVKFGGATGTHAALGLISAENPMALTDHFIKAVDKKLDHVSVTDQINPHDDYAIWCHFAREMVLKIEEMCAQIWEDSGRDIWVEINGEEKLERMLNVKPNEKQSGSSAMPQKVQVINIENARGTLQLLAGTLEVLGNTINRNRLQRELSDSRKIRELFGDVIPKLLHAFESIAVDLPKLTPNPNLVDKESDQPVLRDRYLVEFDDENLENEEGGLEESKIWKKGMTQKVARNQLGDLMTELAELRDDLFETARETAEVPLLAKTHNQPATPTTFGKEIAVFALRLSFIEREAFSRKYSEMDSAICNRVFTKVSESLLWNLLTDLKLYAKRGLIDEDFAKITSLQELFALLPDLGPNEKRCRAELEDHYECLGEAVQTILRRYQVPNAYEIVKKVTRGAQMNKKQYRAMIEELLEMAEIKDRLPKEKAEFLLNLTPAEFLGEAKILAELDASI